MAAVLECHGLAFPPLQPPSQSWAVAVDPGAEPVPSSLLTFIQLSGPLQLLQPLHKPVWGDRREGEASESPRAWGKERAGGGPGQTWEERGSPQKRTRPSRGRGPREGELSPRLGLGEFGGQPRVPKPQARQGHPRATPNVSPHPSGLGPIIIHYTKSRVKNGWAILTAPPVGSSQWPRKGRPCPSSQGPGASRTNPAESRGGRPSERSRRDEGSGQPLCRRDAGLSA